MNQTAILIEIQDADTAAVVDLVDGHSGDHDDDETDHNVTYDLHQDSCEILNSDWICSNGPINLSLCFRICSDDAIEHKRCICKDGSCSWYQKGNSCTTETTPVQNWTSPMNLDTVNTASSTMDQTFMDHAVMGQTLMDQTTMDQTTMEQTNLPTEDSSGNSDFANFPSLDSKTDLMSLINQLNVANSGNINVNFQLK